MLLQRVILFALVWGLALFTLGKAGVLWFEHRQLAAEVQRLEQRRADELKQYAELLAVGQRLANDKQYQLDLLKRRFGYTAPDETPIAVLRDPAK